jgi:hypothetical protein
LARNGGTTQAHPNPNLETTRLYESGGRERPGGSPTLLNARRAGVERKHAASHEAGRQVGVLGSLSQDRSRLNVIASSRLTLTEYAELVLGDEFKVFSCPIVADQLSEMTLPPHRQALDKGPACSLYLVWVDYWPSPGRWLAMTGSTCTSARRPNRRMPVLVRAGSPGSR